MLNKLLKSPIGLWVWWLLAASAYSLHFHTFVLSIPPLVFLVSKRVAVKPVIVCNLASESACIPHCPQRSLERRFPALELLPQLVLSLPSENGGGHILQAWFARLIYGWVQTIAERANVASLQRYVRVGAIDFDCSVA